MIVGEWDCYGNNEMVIDDNNDGINDRNIDTNLFVDQSHHIMNYFNRTYR